MSKPPSLCLFGGRPCQLEGELALARIVGQRGSAFEFGDRFGWSPELDQEVPRTLGSR
jgi:hypothetical protein